MIYYLLIIKYIANHLLTFSLGFNRRINVSDYLIMSFSPRDIAKQCESMSRITGSLISNLVQKRKVRISQKIDRYRVS